MVVRFGMDPLEIGLAAAQAASVGDDSVQPARQLAEAARAAASVVDWSACGRLRSVLAECGESWARSADALPGEVRTVAAKLTAVQYTALAADQDAAAGFGGTR